MCAGPHSLSFPPTFLGVGLDTPAQLVSTRITTADEMRSTVVFIPRKANTIHGGRAKQKRPQAVMQGAGWWWLQRRYEWLAEIHRLPAPATPLAQYVPKMRLRRFCANGGVNKPDGVLPIIAAQVQLCRFRGDPPRSKVKPQAATSLHLWGFEPWLSESNVEPP